MTKTHHGELIARLRPLVAIASSTFLIKRLQRKLEGKLRMLSDNKMDPVIGGSLL